MVRRIIVIGFVILLAFDTLAQVSFKFAAMDAAPAALDLRWVMRLLFSPWTYGAIGGYLGAFVCWMTILKHAHIGPAFAATHLEIVTVLFVSVIFLGESLSTVQVLGSACILCGVVLLGTERAT
jgi:drug/metabolite transporter (DMT)-like permease